MVIKTLVLYTFNSWYWRVEHFIKHAVFQAPDVDFLFIISNGEGNPNRYGIPEYAKIIHRNNIGFDFGAWSEGLLTNNLYKDYTHFIFINSSVLGPFTPSYFKGRWTDIFVNGIQDGQKDNIKLFGCSINLCNDSKNLATVQSYLFAMDLEALEYLIQTGIFTMSTYLTTLQDVIDFREIKMSRDIIAKGWNIGSLLNCYRGIDFTFRDKTPKECNIKEMHEVIKLEHYGKLWTEYEVVFIKGNRINLLSLLAKHFPEKMKNIILDRDGKILN